MKKKFNATKIGIIVTVCSLISTLTFIIPLIAIMPLSNFLEYIFKSHYGNVEYSVIGECVLLTLTLIFATITFFYFLYVYLTSKQHKKISSITLTFLFIILFFVVHPLGHFIDTSSNWSMVKDGQFIMGVINNYPISSFSFVVFGLLTDLIQNYFNPTGLEYIETHHPEKEKQIFIDATLIADYEIKYSKMSNSELSAIINEKGWQVEAKKAAENVLDSRKRLSSN